MGDKTKALRKENDDLKSELIALKKEFQSLKSKMAEQKDCNDAAATSLLSNLVFLVLETIVYYYFNTVRLLVSQVIVVKISLLVLLLYLVPSCILTILVNMTRLD